MQGNTPYHLASTGEIVETLLHGNASFHYFSVSCCYYYSVFGILVLVLEFLVLLFVLLISIPPMSLFDHLAENAAALSVMRARPTLPSPRYFGIQLSPSGSRIQQSDQQQQQTTLISSGSAQSVLNVASGVGANAALSRDQIKVITEEICTHCFNGMQQEYFSCISVYFLPILSLSLSLFFCLYHLY
jgi:hypothetical protein